MLATTRQFFAANLHPSAVERFFRADQVLRRVDRRGLLPQILYDHKISIFTDSAENAAVFDHEHGRIGLVDRREDIDEAKIGLTGQASVHPLRFDAMKVQAGHLLEMGTEQRQGLATEHEGRLTPFRRDRVDNPSADGQHLVSLPTEVRQVDEADIVLMDMVRLPGAREKIMATGDDQGKSIGTRRHASSMEKDNY